MALDSRVQPLRNNNTSVYPFSGSSSSAHHHQANLYDDEEDLLSSEVGFHELGKGATSYRYLKMHQQGHMLRGAGRVISDSNDGSLINFEDVYEVAAGGHTVRYEHNSNTRHEECFIGNSLLNASDLDDHILTGGCRSDLKGKASNKVDVQDWFYPSDLADDQIAAHKHPSMEESCMPPNKKQCTSTATAKKSKTKQPVAAKDPQSIAAKNRRERISERLKTLQELVPNGTKVDLVTMLEKAIGYVKFLQLQVKVLAADEFWPVQGGKAPELSQVKDAIDAILSSQRSDRNSTSD